jgi:hypothetical protein
MYLHIALMFLAVAAGLFLLVCIIAFMAGRFEPAGEVSAVELRETLQQFVDRTDGTWDWDDFISCPLKDPRFEAIRQRCATLDREFPPESKGQYCGPKGIEVIRGYIRELEHVTTG